MLLKVCFSYLTTTIAEKDHVCKAFEWALPSLLTFSQEVDLWKTPGTHVPNIEIL